MTKRMDGRTVFRGSDHGESKANTPLYRTWCAIKTRCTNPNQPSWHRYGGRGIIMCEEWFKSFEAFRDWANAAGYKPGMTIDREDNDGNYEPGNCRWLTRVENIKKSNSERKLRGDGGCVLSASQVSEIKKLINAGKAYKEIACLFNTDRRQINCIALEKTWGEVEPKIVTQRKRAVSKMMSIEDARRVKSLLASGARICDIASEIGVSSHSISFIKAGRAWKNT